MVGVGQRVHITVLGAALGAVVLFAACGRSDEVRTSASEAPAGTPQSVPQSIPMRGEKSVTRFFVTSKGLGKGGDLGGLAGADAHCQALAKVEGSGDHTWRAYLSTTATAGQPAVNARDRIGKGPWYNPEGFLVATNLDELHADNNKINKDTAVTESLNRVNGVGDTPNMHDSPGYKRRAEQPEDPPSSLAARRLATPQAVASFLVARPFGSSRRLAHYMTQM